MLAQVERNDAYLKADFLTKRGQHPVVGATASPPRDFNFDSCSAVLGCFCKVLAVAKVRQYMVALAWHLHLKRSCTCITIAPWSSCTVQSTFALPGCVLYISTSEACTSHTEVVPGVPLLRSSKFNCAVTKVSSWNASGAHLAFVNSDWQMPVL